jgi:hypothetical protein
MLRAAEQEHQWQAGHHASFAVPSSIFLERQHGLLENDLVGRSPFPERPHIRPGLDTYSAAQIARYAETTPASPTLKAQKSASE